MLPDLLLAIAERTANQAIRLDPRVGQNLTKVKQQILQVEIRDWQQSVRIVFDGERLILLSGPEKTGADCLVSADIATLQSLKDPSQITRLIREGKLDLDGDLHLAQAYSGAFGKMDIDWAEQMSGWIGDGAAQALYNGLCSLKDTHSSAVQRGKQTFTSLLQDELKVAIHPLEMDGFKQQTRQLSAAVSELEQRIHRLINR